MKIEEKIKNKIKQFNDFLITTHINADGDAIASELVIYYILKKLNKRAFIINNDPVPESLLFLPRVMDIKTITDKPINFREKYLAIVLDAPNPQRTGRIEKAIKMADFVINIDHHISNSEFGDINWVKEDASCVGEMLYGLCRSFKFRLDYDTALAIYTAIVTDTGSFRYTNTTKSTHNISGHLINSGVNPNDIYNKLFENNSVERMHIIGSGLISLKKKGFISWLEIAKKDFSKSRSKREDLEGMVDFPRSIKGVKVALFFQELNNGFIRVALRSKDEAIDVNEIATLFSGGGHRMASGCRIKGDLKSVRNKVLKETEKYIRNSKSKSKPI